MHRPVLTIPPPYRDVAWTRVYEELVRLHQGRQAREQAMRDLETTYGRRQGRDAERVWIGQGIPAAGYRVNRYQGPAWGTGGNSSRRWEWNKSTAWEYWIPGCLSESSTRFRKYFRVSRERFDMIYEAAATSGQFGLNPEDPMYSKVYPGPPRPGRHQDFKKIPLCLCIAASFRRVASGCSFAILAEEFHISSSALLAFDKKFWKWFRKQYFSASLSAAIQRLSSSLRSRKNSSNALEVDGVGIGEGESMAEEGEAAL
jgi:hypothetical protein